MSFLLNLQNNSDCTPFEEAITEPTEEEEPKSLLEVRDTESILINAAVNEHERGCLMFFIKIFLITRCTEIR